MYNIENVKLKPCKESKYLKLQRMEFTQDGIQKSWDLAHVHDSVSIVLYHKEKEALVLVKQFRPPVYLKNNDGFTYELCAGLVDKDEKSLVEIAQEEILEECGFEVSTENIERITTFYTSVGFAGASQTLFYAEVLESMHTAEGGGIDHENIEVHYLPRERVKEFIYDENYAKTPGLMFALGWWLGNKC